MDPGKDGIPLFKFASPFRKGESNDKKKSTHFQGTAYRLGGENDPGAMIEAPAPVPATPQIEQVVVTMWKNGVSLDGTFTAFPDSDQKQIDMGNRIKIVKEVLAQTKGKGVIMKSKTHKDYVEPKVPFSGCGNRLGEPTDDVVSSATESTSDGSADNKFLYSDAVNASLRVEVNESLPVTNLQIRMPNGSKSVTKFNHSHTVADVRGYIIRNHTCYSNSKFVLMTTFPNKEITDESLTLEAAKLINSVLVVHLK